jgi:hypothetical protein
MTTDMVNSNLIQLDTMLPTRVGRVINIGGTNAAPTATGIAARDSLVLKGWSVVTS